MNRKAAEYKLGLSEPYDENAVRLAYKRALKLAHPDTGGSGEGAAENIRLAQTARDVLLKHLGTNSVDKHCPSCKGTGSIRSGFFSAVCKPCNGSGKA